MLAAQCNRMNSVTGIGGGNKSPPSTVMAQALNGADPNADKQRAQNSAAISASSFQPWKKVKLEGSGNPGAGETSALTAGELPMSSIYHSVGAPNTLHHQATPHPGLTSAAVYGTYPTGTWLQQAAAQAASSPASGWFDIHHASGTSTGSWLDPAAGLRAAAAAGYQHSAASGTPQATADYGAAAAFGQSTFPLLTSSQGPATASGVATGRMTNR